MRVLRLVSALLAFTGGPAFAQEPIDYVSKLDFFSINFPSEPKVEQATYPDEYRLDPLPARVYTADQGRNHYKVTVVDYRDVSKMHAARNAKCVHDVGADKPGLTPQQRRDLTGDACQDETVKDIRGAMMWATWNLVEKAAKVTHLAHYNIEATVPKNAPASNWFQISVRFLDENYKPVRYQYSGLMMYSNGYPKPPLANQGNQGAQGQAAQGR